MKRIDLRRSGITPAVERSNEFSSASDHSTTNVRLLTTSLLDLQVSTKIMVEITLKFNICIVSRSILGAKAMLGDSIRHSLRNGPKTSDLIIILPANKVPIESASMTKHINPFIGLTRIYELSCCKPYHTIHLFRDTTNTEPIRSFF